MLIKAILLGLVGIVGVIDSRLIGLSEHRQTTDPE